MKAKDRIIFALDVPGVTEAAQFISRLGGEGTPADGHVGAFKVGLELFVGAGLPVLRIIKQPVMFDLKLLDIPETVERAVKRAGELGVAFLTLHAQQQRETLRRAATAAESGGVQLLAVTVLTSVTEQDLVDLAHPGLTEAFRRRLSDRRQNNARNAEMHGSIVARLESAAAMNAYELALADLDELEQSSFKPSERALALAKFAWEQGIKGFVCSPQEAKGFREALPDAIIVTPGVRPVGAAAGDQKRIGTPAQAIQDGADYIVVGRPIRDAPDPIASARSIAQEIAAVTCLWCGKVVSSREHVDKDNALYCSAHCLNQERVAEDGMREVERV